MKQIRKIKSLITNPYQEKVEEMFIFCLSKLNQEKFYSDFLTSRQKYFKRLIYRYFKLFNFQINVQNNIFEDFNQKLIFKQIQIFSKNVSRYFPQIIKYYNLHIKGYLIDELNKFKKENNILHLEDSKFENKTYFDVLSNEYL